MRELQSYALSTSRIQSGHCIRASLSYLTNLISKWYDGLPEVSDLGNASCVHFRKIVRVVERREQKYDRFLRGRQVVCLHDL